MPPTKSTMTNPNIAQVPITPTDGQRPAEVAEPGLANAPSPTARSPTFTGPFWSKIQRQLTPTTTGATTWGRKKIARRMLLPRTLTRASDDATNSPMINGKTA